MRAESRPTRGAVPGGLLGECPTSQAGKVWSLPFLTGLDPARLPSNGWDAAATGPSPGMGPRGGGFTGQAGGRLSSSFLRKGTGIQGSTLG